MILVDSSVWIDYFNGRATSQTEWLYHALGMREIVTGDLILLEVLQGFRRNEDYLNARQLLSSLRMFTLLNPALAIKAADNYRTLRQRGITVRRTVDTIIATFCIEHDLPLLFSDRDFLPFRQHLGLRAINPDDTLLHNPS